MDNVTLNKMQEWLPDYAFGNLSDKHRKAFDQNLERFPEIKKELRDIQNVFKKADQFDLDKMMKQNSRNISVKVQKRRASRKKVSFGSNFVYKVFIPSLAVLFMAYLTFFVNIFDAKKSSKIEQSIFSGELISDQEMTILLEDDPLLVADQIVQYEVAYYNDNFVGSEIGIIGNFELTEKNINALNSYIDIDHFLENISEDDFQMIIRNMYDEKFGV